ncbi:MAG: purine-nucleoside phosphorylase [Bacteroidota bacterium]|nr:purine-nucleoside phosphorylase [Bacteroidota bacterium]
MLKKIEESVQFLKSRTGIKPEAGIILGTGLGGLTSEIQVESRIKYTSIPNFTVSTVEGHEGQLIFGRLGNKEVMAMQGRLHFYEGHSMADITFPIRVMKKLGVKLLIISNASGGLNPEFEIGDIMFIRDHINLMPNPLLGKNLEEMGPRFVDMSKAYDPLILKFASDIALEKGIKHHTGIYAGVTGPTFETPAEYAYLHRIGADAVGMSTVPEVIVARHMKMKCFAVSIITDLGVEGKIVEISHKEVIEAAKLVEPRMTIIIKTLLDKSVLK